MAYLYDLESHRMSLSFNEEEAKNLREACNKEKGNVIDFNSVPTRRIYDYNDKCYDIEHIIIDFNANWLKEKFRFTIDQKHIASFETMQTLARKYTEYQLGIHNGYSEFHHEYMYYIGEVKHSGELIHTNNFVQLLMFDLVDDPPSTLCKLIITYDTNSKPRNLLQILKILYFFSNVYSFKDVKPFYVRYFPHIVSKLEREHEGLSNVINDMYDYQMGTPEI